MGVVEIRSRNSGAVAVRAVGIRNLGDFFRSLTANMRLYKAELTVHIEVVVEDTLVENLVEDTEEGRILLGYDIAVQGRTT